MSQHDSLRRLDAAYLRDAQNISGKGAVGSVVHAGYFALPFAFSYAVARRVTNHADPAAVAEDATRLGLSSEDVDFARAWRTGTSTQAL